MKKAIVTMTIGLKYKKMFDDYCRTNWQLYCNKFDYELIVITESLDKSERALKRSCSWQKLLILSQKWSFDYDRIVWIDADVIINSSKAYDICDGVPIEKVGGVDEYSIPTQEIHALAQERTYKYWEQNNIKYLDNTQPHAFYTNRGISGNNLSEVLQAGIFVCSPKHHRDIFEYTYNNYDIYGTDWNYEMPAISFELVKANMVHWISPRFNFCVLIIMAAFYPEILLRKIGRIDKLMARLTKRFLIEPINKKELECLKNIYDLSIFMHFAGCSDMMRNFNLPFSES